MTENELIKKAIELHNIFKMYQEQATSNLDLNFDNFTDFIYEQTSDSIVWNEDNSIEDLENHDGNTYSVEVNWVEYEDEEFLLIDGENGCGDRHIRCLFSKKNEIQF